MDGINMKQLIVLALLSFAFSQPALNCCDYQEIAENECNGLGCYIPQCTEECEWESIQCWSSTGYCWCVDEEGNEIEGTNQPSWQELPECSEECDDPYIEIEGYCFHQDDIDLGGQLPYSYNWPYDFFSLVELAQMEAQFS